MSSGLTDAVRQNNWDFLIHKLYHSEEIGRAHV